MAKEEFLSQLEQSDRAGHQQARDRWAAAGLIGELSEGRVIELSDLPFPRVLTRSSEDLDAQAILGFIAGTGGPSESTEHLVANHPDLSVRREMFFPGWHIYASAAERLRQYSQDDRPTYNVVCHSVEDEAEARALAPDYVTPSFHDGGVSSTELT